MPLVAAILLAASLAAPQSPAVRSARMGWEAIDAGRLTEAAAAFDAALSQGPQEPDILVGAALAAHLLGRADVARRYLVDALRIAPSLTPASMLLGEVLYRSGDLDGAIDTYERALALAPGHAHLARKLEAWRKEAALHGRFGQKLGDHFTVLFEGPAEAELAERAVAILEAAYWRIGTALYTYPAGVITVVLYTREQFRDITQSPEWAGGAFDGRIRVPVQGALENLRDFERVLAHEFTHALVRSIAARGVPLWLDEGLAEAFESRGDTGTGSPGRSAGQGGVPLARMETSFARLDTDEARLAYAQSALAVRSLLDLAGAAAVVNLLADVGNGQPFAAAFERHVHISYAAFQQQIDGAAQK